MDEIDKLLELIDMELILCEALKDLSQIEEHHISEIQSFSFPPSEQE